MLRIHAQSATDGRVLFQAEAFERADISEEGAFLAGEPLYAALGDVMGFGDAFPPPEDPACGALAPPWKHVLRFFSRVRGEKFRTGVFLAADVLALAQTFRAAAGAVAHGRYLPVLREDAEGFCAVWEPVAQGTPFFAACVDQLARRAGRTLLETGEKAETAEDAWLSALRADAPRVDYAAEDAQKALRRHGELEDLKERLRAWYRPLQISAADRAALTFTLLAPASREGAWRVAYEAPRSRRGLTALGQAIRIFPPLENAAFRKEDAERFLRTGAGALKAAGFAVNVPAGLLGEHFSAALDMEGKGEKPVSGAAALTEKNVTARLTVRVDGEVVTAAEIRFLLDQNSPFVFFRNRWIEVDRFVLKEALRALESVRGKPLSTYDALSFATGARRLGRLKVAAVAAHGWLRGLLNTLKGAEGFRVLKAPEGFRGTLTDYQARGYSWLAFLTQWGFGPCLADDMGLGKTVQTIAWILRQRQTGVAAPVLVVAPVSVTTNWQRELKRFAPALKVLLHQGADRRMGGTFLAACRLADVVVTGYALLVRDFGDFQAATFSAVVLDEAQTVKNPDTRVSKTVRALDVPMRLALTGTPLENAALDLWSIEEFLNPGLLGTRRDFTETFARDLAVTAAAHQAAAAASKLRHALAPFMLRRLKSDPKIAAELGDKREMREYCTLSAEQRRAYEAALRDFRARAAEPAASPLARRGQVLALLTALKLVCDGAGKFARLDELIEEIFQAGESALIFTQYVQVARRLRAHLAETRGRLFPFLHGGLAAAAREKEIAAFNADAKPNVFLISLKAGGFGLNLTRATHVIHFDRWWNPAVENQATDRAHRIGQRHTVFVHLFMCAGTLEERIDRLLEEKRRLAGEVITSGEAFLAEMGARDLERMVALA